MRAGGHMAAAGVLLALAAAADGADEPKLLDQGERLLHELISHSAEIDQRIEHILAELKRLGLRIDEKQTHPLDANSLNKMVD